MKCRKCNLPIQKEDKVCPHCGAKIKRPAKLIFLSSLALILVMGVVIATFWFQDGLPNVKDQTAKQDPVSVTDSDDNDKDDKNKDKEKAEKEKPKKESRRRCRQPSDKGNKHGTEKPKQNKNTADQTDDEHIVGENAAPKEEPKSKKQKRVREQKEETTPDVT